MPRFLSLLVVFLGLAPLHAQEDKIPWVKLSVEPAAAPVPALKYQLLPEVRDLKPGNAALLYQRAHAPESFNAFLRHPDYKHFDAWFDLPLEKLPVDKARRLLPKFVLDEVDLAARREYCDWAMTERIRKDGFGMLLPDVQVFRYYAWMLAMRARLEMLEKRHDKVVYTLQTGFAMSRHLGEQPILISSLVSLAISYVMANEVDNLVQQPKAPNLYWALTDLPRPFIDIRKGMQLERIALEILLPEIRQALTDPKNPPLRQEQLEAVISRLQGLADQQGGIKKLGISIAANVAAALVHKEAKQFLIAQGYPANRLEALPPLQVALMYDLAQFDQFYDDQRKWHGLPYREALAGIKEANDKRCATIKNSKPSLLSLGLLVIPDLYRLEMAQARLDSRLAALRIVEALRLHVAANDGKLPATLGEIRAVPIPVDPLTGKGFVYQIEGNKARLSRPLMLGETAGTPNLVRYEITFRESKR